MSLLSALHDPAFARKVGFLMGGSSTVLGFAISTELGMIAGAITALGAAMAGVIPVVMGAWTQARIRDREAWEKANRDSILAENARLATVADDRARALGDERLENAAIEAEVQSLRLLTRSDRERITALEADLAMKERRVDDLTTKILQSARLVLAPPDLVDPPAPRPPEPTPESTAQASQP